MTQQRFKVEIDDELSIIFQASWGTNNAGD